MLVRSYGLTINTFNSLSKKISDERTLKQRVLLQSYYYRYHRYIYRPFSLSSNTNTMLKLSRIAADLELNIRNQLPTLPAVSTAGGILKFSPISDDKYQAIKSSDSTLTRFCKTLRTIEYERLKLREALQVSKV